MKLVDILARELKACPEPTVPLNGGKDDCCQSDETTEVYFGFGRDSVRLSKRAENTIDVSVTRAEWQSAVDALNALKVVEWSGVGLPPIGMASCEYLGAHQYDEWTVVNIFAHYGHTVFVDFGDGWRAEKDSSRFRPIKTAEQLAEEERKSQILDMIDSFGTDTAIWGRDAVMEICGHLWEYGYRKQ